MSQFSALSVDDNNNYSNINNNNNNNNSSSSDLANVKNVPSANGNVSLKCFTPGSIPICEPRVPTSPLTPVAVAAETSSFGEPQDWEWQRLKADLEPWAADLEAESGFGARPVGVALVGLGRMGFIHLRNLLREPSARLLYCFDANERCVSNWSNFFARQGEASAMGDGLARGHPRALMASEFKVALEDERVEAVLVAVPTDLHEHFTRLALGAGKNVLCEKPLTPNTANIGQLYELARQNNAILLCAFNRRYDPDLRALRARVATRSQACPVSSSRGPATAPSLGALQLVRVSSRDRERPPLAYVRSSGGLFHDTVIHDIDLAMWMAQQLPEQVHVIGRTWREQFQAEPQMSAQLSDTERALLAEIDDYFVAVVTMKFGDGSLAAIDNSRQASYGYDQRCELFCSNAMLRCDGRRPLHTLEVTSDGELMAPINCNFASRYAAAYENELRDLLAAARLGRRNPSRRGRLPPTATSEGTADRANCDDEDNYDADDEPPQRAAAIRRHLLEPDRPALVEASHRVADACARAARLGAAVVLEWSPEFRARFAIDIA